MGNYPEEWTDAVEAEKKKAGSMQISPVDPGTL